VTDVATQDPALQAIAFAVATRLLDHAVMTGEVDDHWPDYPEIGENDWIRITDAVRRIAGYMYPAAEDIDQAYATLAKRASNQ